MPEHRKTLFIIADQFRADLLTGRLGAHVDLPNLRAFRAEAVSFERHYSVANPCGPSRASILTGLYAMTHRSVRNGTPLADHHTNLARQLRKGGIEPLLFGYTDTPLDPRTRPAADPALHTYEEVMPGFREIVEMRLEYGSLPWQAHLRAKGYEFPSYADLYRPRPEDPARPPRPEDPALYRAQDSDTAFLADAFMHHMAPRAQGPWFAALTFIRPHPPFVAPAPYNSRYSWQDMPPPLHLGSPAAEEAVHPFIAAQRAQPPISRQVIGCGEDLDEASEQDIRRLRALYCALATELDTHFGRIIAWLKETGQYDETLIVFMADHGEMLGDRFMWGKSHVYEPAWHVPLMIRDPRWPEAHGTTVRALTENTDIAPTLLDLCNLPVPPAMDGRSLRPFLEGRSPEGWRDCTMSELDFGDPQSPGPAQQTLGLRLQDCALAILREARYKLVHFSADLPPLLFDLKDDPQEMRNLADDPAHAETLLRLTRKLLSHRMRHADHALSHMKITEKGVFGYRPG